MPPRRLIDSSSRNTVTSVAGYARKTRGRVLNTHKTKQAFAGNVSANAVPCVENHTYIVSNQACYSSNMEQRGIARDSILLLTIK